MGGRPSRTPAALRRALLFWSRLHGLLSLEPADHFTGMGLDPAEPYESELRHLTGWTTPSGHRAPEARGEFGSGPRGCRMINVSVN